MNKSKTVFALVLLVCWGAQAVWALETVLHYSLTENSKPLATASKKSKKEITLTSKKTVVLGRDFFSVREGALERIYDFKGRRIHYLDHDQKVRAEISLFSDPAFRIQELQYRLQMDEAVQKAGGKNREDLFTLESIFGVETERLDGEIKVNGAVKGEMSFFREKENLAKISWEPGFAAPPDGMFLKFLIYDNSLHPFIRKKIAASQKIPSVIRSRLVSPDTEDHFTLILDDAKSRADQGFQIPEHYAVSQKRPGAAVHALTLNQLIQSVQSGKNQAVRHDKDWFLNFKRQAVENKNYLDAALAVLEYGLQSGDQPVSAGEMQKLAAQQKEDPELDRFFRSLGVSGEEQAHRAITELRKINRKKLSHGHVIDMIIANQQSVLGQNEDARKNMLSALQVNPYIAGAYKDLGDMFFADFDMVSAWVCWDFARKQAPSHFMLKPITDYEDELIRNFPEFFN